MTVALKQIIAARVRAARKAKGWTQAELAEAIGRTVEAVSNIERALSLAPIDVLERMAHALDVTLVDLVTSLAGPSAKGERAELEMRIRLSATRLTLEQLRIAAVQIDALREGGIATPAP